MVVWSTRWPGTVSGDPVLRGSQDAKRQGTCPLFVMFRQPCVPQDPMDSMM